MVHGRHLDLGALERAEAALDDHQPLVSAGGIFKADGVVVGLDHPFAIILGCLPNGSTIDSNLL